jgi:uncharacterized protein YcaQ
VQQLFGFHQVLEIFKPAAQRIYGYYCLPVLAGDRLVARFDLKADHKKGTLRVLSRNFEETSGPDTGTPPDRETAQSAVERFANALGLSVR